MTASWSTLPHQLRIAGIALLASWTTVLSWRVLTEDFGEVAIPLLVSDGLNGLAIGMTAMGVVSLGVRLFYLARLFPALRIVRHMARAMAPTVPAAGAVLALRLLEGSDRTLAMALGELALYVLVAGVATVLLERDLLREVAGYLRPAPAEADPQLAKSSA